jgi:hypothetical protein
MSPLVDVSGVLARVKPLTVDLNKTDKVSEILLVKKWDKNSLEAAVAGENIFALSGADQVFACELAVLLSEFDFHLIERAIHKIGVDKMREFLEQTTSLISETNSSLDALESNRDAIFTSDGRRRTPGGVFWRILKSSSDHEDAKYIFKDNTKRQQTIRRKIVRDKWTENHLTVLRPSKVQKKNDTAIEAIKKIASTLSMSEISIIERLIVRKSIEYAMEVVEETNRVLASNTLLNDVGRKRTPGGVFANIVKSKSDISDDDKKFIFARATGGRAPSMCDLMTMSEAIRDRPKKAVVVVDASTDDWEYQKKVGNVWYPGFVGQDSFGSEMERVADDELTDEESVLTKLTKGLRLFNDIWFLHRAKNTVGMTELVRLYHESIDIELKGGLKLSENNGRKRTPKGVFISCLKKKFSSDIVNKIIGGSIESYSNLLSATAPSTAAPEVAIFSTNTTSRLADKIIVELERMRIPESDFEIVRNAVALKGEHFVRTLFERVRKRFNKGKWQDTPGQLFGRMLKSSCSNEEMNEVFEASRSTQQLRHLSNVSQAAGRSLVRRASNSLYSRTGTPGLSDEQCAREITIGLALIGVTASDVSTIERVITKLGDTTAIALLERTREIEREGGQRTRDGKRRKTPSGVYLSLLTTEQRVPKDDLKYIFERTTTTSDERRKEDFHFAPSLFTPVNPFRVIDSSGKSAEFIESIKTQVRPTLDSLEYISVLDPRLETVIRGVVLLGTDAINLIDQCVYYFGEKRTEGWLEISHAQVTDNSAATNLPTIYNDLVKAAGGLPEKIARHSMGC